MDKWTTYGPVRGCCGHRHRSERTARAYLRQDAEGCATQGGYSDRRVVRVGDETVGYADRCGMGRVWRVPHAD